MRDMMHIGIVAVLLLGSPVDPAPAAQADVESFDQIWRTIAERHFDPTFGGLDWEAVRTELRPRVERASSREEAREILEEMLSRLHLSHFNVIPEEVFAVMGPGRPEEEEQGETGVDVRMVDGHALVTSVREGSSGEGAGIRPGWEVLRVGATDIPPLLDRLAKEVEGEGWRDLVLSSVVIHELQGRVGESLTVDFLDGEDRRVARTLDLTRPEGRLLRVGSLPPGRAAIDVDTLEGGVGYIAFNLFFDPAVLMPVFNHAMESFATSPGIIIDLRGNGGGIGEMATGMAGWLIDREGTSFGTLRGRDYRYELTVRPRPSVYRGPVAVLVDGLSVSAAEFMAAGLKDAGRARVFGSRTAGAALPSTIERLPNGDGFQYVLADFITSTGRRLEGVGVTPDEETPLDRPALLAGRDPAREAAVRWITADR